MSPSEVKFSATLRKPSRLEVVPDNPALLSEWPNKTTTTSPRGSGTTTTRASAPFANIGGHAASLLAHAPAVRGVVLECWLPERVLQTADEIGQLGGGDGRQDEQRALGAETGAAAEV